VSALSLKRILKLFTVKWTILISVLGERKMFLYDGGNRDKRSDNLFKVIRKGCPKDEEGNYLLNGIVVSHPDKDHLGGVVRLLTKKPALIAPCPVLLTTAFLKLRSMPAVRDLLDCLANKYNFKPVKEYCDDTGKPVAVQDLHQSFHCIFHKASNLCEAWKFFQLSIWMGSHSTFVLCTAHCFLVFVTISQEYFFPNSRYGKECELAKRLDLAHHERLALSLVLFC